MTITVPLRRMTLQLSQRALTEALTFNGSSLLESVSDPAAGEVVWRNFDRDAIAGQDANAIATHISRKRREHLMTTRNRHAKGGVRE